MKSLTVTVNLLTVTLLISPSLRKKPDKVFPFFLTTVSSIP